MQIAVGVEAQLRWAVVATRQPLTGIAERLEVADGFGVLQGRHGCTWGGTACKASPDTAVPMEFPIA